MIRTRQTTIGRDLERLLRDGVRPARGDAYLLDRYLGERDEAAFETLVERHGPMVLSLCRRYLRDPRDVEDAFQATFLILVRKGPGLRDKSSLSSWLYGVAYRVAVRSRSNLLKRRAREVQTDAILQAPARTTNPPDDSVETLDAELSRLPEKYRAPMILCYLEGRTHEQAAAELGWPVGTVRSRMAKARAILARRLSRLGLDAPASLALSRPDLLVETLSTTVPASLVQATSEVAGRFVGIAARGTGGAASVTSISTTWPATALAQGVLTAMLISQLKWIGLGTTALGLLAATAGMGAWAVTPPSKLEGDPNPVQESKPAEAKPAPAQTLPGAQPQTRPQVVDVEARLAEMDRKMDRLMERFERMMTPAAPQSPAAAAPPVEPAGTEAPPPASPRPRVRARGAEPSPAFPLNPRSDDERRNPSPTFKDPTDGGLREIEARLMNALNRHTLTKALFERGQLSQLENFAPLEESRVLIARLKGIEDQLTGELEFVETIESPSVGAEVLEAQSRQQDARLAVERYQALAKQHSTFKPALADAEMGLRVASFELFVKKKELERCKLQEGLLRTRLKQAQRILDWAKSHFKELGSLDGPAFDQPAPGVPIVAPPPPSAR